MKHLPHTSALSKSVHGEAAEWGLDAHLLASAVDALNAANWQRGGGKGKRPKPIPRPGDEGRRQTRTIGTASLTPGELESRLSRPRTAVRPA